MIARFRNPFFIEIMKNSIQFGLCLLLLLSLKSPVKAQRYLFSHPRQGGFKFKANDDYDITNPIHFLGTGILAVGFYKFIKHENSSHPRLVAGVLASSLGLLKELEDGYREGWGMKDVMFNELGVLSFLLLAEHLHYSATFEQALSSSREYGVGLRYFRTSDITPLNASFGLYTHYSTLKESELGFDLHFFLIGKTELHLGFAFAKFKNAAVFGVQRPNIGLAFRLF